MSHPSSQSETVGDIQVKVSAFKKNYYFYKSIGVDVKVRKTQKKRRWWCAGLCKTHVDFKAKRIRIDNTYYTTIDNTAIIVEAASHAAECQNKADCTLKHFAAGVGVKIKFPGGGRPSPSAPDNLLPLSAVVGRVTVELPNKILTFNVGKGQHPG